MFPLFPTLHVQDSYFFFQHWSPTSALLQGYCPSARAVRLFFDADPFPVRVRFLLFQGNGRPESRSFSLFLFPLKEEMLLCFIFLSPPPPSTCVGQIWNVKKKKKDTAGQVLVSKNGDNKGLTLLKEPQPPTATQTGL